METLAMDLMGAGMLIGAAAVFVVGLIRLTFWN